MKKIQLTLTDHEAQLIELKANEFGYSLPKMIKFLVSAEADKIWEKIAQVKTAQSTYKKVDPSKKTLQAMVSEGRAEYKAGQAKSFSSFLDELNEDK